MISFNKKLLLCLFVAFTGQQCVAYSLPAFLRPSNKSLSLLLAAGVGVALYKYIKHMYEQSAGPRKQVAHYYAGKESDTLITEPVEWPVKLVYDDNPLSWMLSWAGGYVGKYITRHAGNVANSENPEVVKAKIDHFQSFYKDVLHMHEFYEPAAGFRTFNDWFIREFKDIEKSRPFCEHDALMPTSLSIASPADSKLLIIPNISQDAQVMIKEKLFDLKKFLGDERLAQRFEGGVMMIFRLAPYDYHRYHYPFTCLVGQERYINGDYHSVNPRAFNVGCKPLTENLRSFQVLTPIGLIETSKQAVMVQVGATAVASIKNHFMDYESNQCMDVGKVYRKGQETGYFQFGGSTVVLLFPKDTIIPDHRIVQNSENGYETAVKVRETVAKWIEPGSLIYNQPPINLG